MIKWLYKYFSTHRLFVGMQDPQCPHFHNWGTTSSVWRWPWAHQEPLPLFRNTKLLLTESASSMLILAMLVSPTFIIYFAFVKIFCIIFFNVGEIASTSCLKSTATFVLCGTTKVYFFLFLTFIIIIITSSYLLLKKMPSLEFHHPHQPQEPNQARAPQASSTPSSLTAPINPSTPCLSSVCSLLSPSMLPSISNNLQN